MKDNTLVFATIAALLVFSAACGISGCYLHNKTNLEALKFRTQPILNE
jgi:hypothetical protein